MPRGLFVTGNDTAVGKTVVSAAMMGVDRRRWPVRYWKPIQTGIEQDDDTAVVARLAGCAPGEVFDQGVRLPHPVSPHLAARLAGRTISVDSVFAQVGAAVDAGASMLALPGASAVDGARPDRTFWIVEGAGGVLVPLNDDELMVDLMIQLGLPAVVVSRTAIGTINHTLLTLDLLGRRSVEVAAVVMSGPPDAAAREAIERHGRVFVAQLPVLEPLDAAAIAAWAEGVAWPI